MERISVAALRAKAREQEAKSSSSIMVDGRFVRTHNSMPIEGLLSRVSRSVGQLEVVETQEYEAVPKSRHESVVGVFTDGHIVESKEQGFKPKESEDWTYVAVVTQHFDPSETIFKPFTYYLVTNHHTREDIENLVDKLPGNKLQIT